jgi:hypothetical protein
MPSGDRLPFVDELDMTIEAGPDAVWGALLRVVERSLSSARTARGARLLRSADRAASGPRPLAAGSTLPGFHVEAAERPRELALAGEHRFAAYALTFRLDDLDDGQTRLRAETRATFPGAKGRLYRALVIGTRAHVLVTRRLLGAVKRRSEK